MTVAAVDQAISLVEPNLILQPTIPPTIKLQKKS
jgi:ABC-type uncharacterized transport system YnjBCD permease subunit